MSFSAARETRAERLLSDAGLCDAFAKVGSEQQRVPCHRAHLANVSEPLRKAFYGDFQESTSREVALPEVTLAVFNCISRFAIGLDPKLDADNVIETLRAAKMYMIKDLEDECEHFLRMCVTAENVLAVMTKCLISKVALPAELEIQYWVILLKSSKQALRSPSFIVCHGDIILCLLMLDEFKVKEEHLWSRLVEWTENVKERSELWGGVADEVLEISKSKRVKLETPTNDESAQWQKAVLQNFGKRLRIPVMSNDFFVDNVRQHLTREDSDKIMTHFLLKRPVSPYITLKRAGIQPPEELLQICVYSSNAPHHAERLPQGGTSWKLDANASNILRVATADPIRLTKIRLTLEAEGDVWAFKVAEVSDNKRIPKRGGQRCTLKNGRVRLWRADPGEERFAKLWTITPRDVTAPLSRYAAAVKLELFGKRSENAHATDIVNRLSTDLLLLQKFPQESD